MSRPSASQPFPTVLLRHSLPDDTTHIDWMLGQDTAGKEKLISFRAPKRIDELEAGDSITIEHIGDHRTDYLSYEGPVSEEHGEVRRLCSGRIDSWEQQPGAWRVSISWQQPDGSLRIQRLTVEQQHAAKWSVTCVDAEKQKSSGREW